MLVYRDPCAEVGAREVVSELERTINQLEQVAVPTERALLEAFLTAAQVECALADREHAAAKVAAHLCDELAHALLGGRALCRRTPGARAPYRQSHYRQSGGAARIVADLATMDLPDRLELRRPEGHAYYGLHPCAFAELGRSIPISSESAVVIGVRSIGTSLAAAFCAALSERGLRARRVSVRPGGHPWARRLRFEGDQAACICNHRSADFFVVDEGPGLSGSTFLAVAEALVAHGVPAERITLCGTREADPARLVASDAPSRWSRFRKRVAPAARVPNGAVDFSAGQWRRLAYASPSEWPACWPEQERLKYRVAGGDLVKFEGLPPYDEAPRRRAEALADAGFGPPVRSAEPGFLGFSWLAGPPARDSDRRVPIERIATYLAFRAHALRAPCKDTRSLETMARVNVSEALGIDLPPDYQLDLEIPVYADARMMPHEWLIAADGTAYKTDGIDHGDDHIYPGPTDIAWDLAGAVIEWGLDRRGADHLLAYYRQSSGDDASRRFCAYAIAYGALHVGRAALAEMGATDDERDRLRQARARYEACLRRYVTEFVG